MKKVFKIVWNVVQVLIIIYAILVISFMLMSNKYGYSEFGKYVLNVDNDEFVVLKKTDDIKNGDMIYYYSVVNEKYKIVFSNINSINDDKTYSLDNGEKILKSKIIGKSCRKVPVIGFILNRVKGQVGFLVFVLLPILIVFIYHIYKFIIEINYGRKKE